MLFSRLRSLKITSLNEAPHVTSETRARIGSSHVGHDSWHGGRRYHLLVSAAMARLWWARADFQFGAYLFYSVIMGLTGAFCRESLTGQRFRVHAGKPEQENPFSVVHCVFNHQNFFANVQVNDSVDNTKYQHASLATLTGIGCPVAPKTFEVRGFLVTAKITSFLL